MRDSNATAYATCNNAWVVNSVQGVVATGVREPDAGNLHVRFDEGERIKPRSLLDRDAVRDKPRRVNHLKVGI